MSPPLRPPTLEEVARAAGVGRGTVSRVVNGSTQVSARTREVVERAVAELGYVPNQAARALMTRRTDTVALVIAEDEQRVFTEPFFAELVRGISHAVEEASLRLVLSLVPGQHRMARLRQFLAPQHVDGILAVSMHDGLALPLSADAPVPVVFAGRPRDPAAWWVDVDNRGGARSAVAHLVARGRRTIGCIAGPQDMASGRDRLEGYREALREAGLPLDDDLVVVGDFSTAGGGLVNELLDRRPRLDAIFAANDLMALGAMNALAERGRVVPDDVAIVGFDGSSAAATSRPALTTVRQPVGELGAAMVELLLARIADPDSPAQSRVLAADLRVGDTS